LNPVSASILLFNFSNTLISNDLLIRLHRCDASKLHTEKILGMLVCLGMPVLTEGPVQMQL